jgi:hypothetical protein
VHTLHALIVTQEVCTLAGPRTLATAVFGLQLAPLLSHLCRHASCATAGPSANGVSPGPPVTTPPSPLDGVGAAACAGFKELLACGGFPLSGLSAGASPTDYSDDDVVLVEDAIGSQDEDVVCLSAAATIPFGSRGPAPTPLPPPLPQPVACALRASFCLAAAAVVDSSPSGTHAEPGPQAAKPEAIPFHADSSLGHPLKQHALVIGSSPPPFLAQFSSG